MGGAEKIWTKGEIVREHEKTSEGDRYVFYLSKRMTKTSNYTLCVCI